MFEVNEKNAKSYARNLSIATIILILFTFFGQFNLFGLILVVSGVIIIFGLNKKDLYRYRFFLYVIYGFSIFNIGLILLASFITIISMIMSFSDETVLTTSLLGMILVFVYLVIYIMYTIALYKFLKYIRSTKNQQDNQPENVI